MSRRLRRTRRSWGLRSRNEHGAVAVMVALLMVPLIGFVAVSVDVAALWSQRQQLQTGADAAALAIAADCLRGSCGSPAQTATTLARANLGSGTPTATVTARSPASVTVRNTAAADLVFAPVLGFRSATVTTEAKAAWGAPTGGVGVLPVLLNYCEYSYQTAGGLPASTAERTLLMSQTSVSSCTASWFGDYEPGGFAWSRANHTGCITSTRVGSEVEVGTSTSPPSNGCTEDYVGSLHNRTVLLPVFRSGRGDKNDAHVQVYGYAAFTLTGYNLGSSYTWNSPCSASERCLRGYFTRLDEQSSLFSYGAAPHLGAGFARLTD
ncbi:hypothetical protein GCM10009616_11690 [Microlunatus lacustris]